MAALLFTAALSQAGYGCRGFAGLLEAEFHFTRLEYVHCGWAFGRRPWLVQCWPGAEEHFAQGICRLTNVDIGTIRHARQTADRIFEYPLVFATRGGHGDFSDEDVAQFREYLIRGGLLCVNSTPVHRGLCG